jgi:RNase H-fold protein (predicted Holliday junction resolvase)
MRRCGVAISEAVTATFVAMGESRRRRRDQLLLATRLEEKRNIHEVD